MDCQFDTIGPCECLLGYKYFCPNGNCSLVAMTTERKNTKQYSKIVCTEAIRSIILKDCIIIIMTLFGCDDNLKFLLACMRKLEMTSSKCF